MAHNQHHKNLKLEIPAWLWFSLYYSMQPNQQWNEEKEKVALQVKKSLKQFLSFNCIENDIITEPNNYDCVYPYGYEPSSAKERIYNSISK